MKSRRIKKNVRNRSRKKTTQRGGARAEDLPSAKIIEKVEDEILGIKSPPLGFSNEQRNMQKWVKTMQATPTVKQLIYEKSEEVRRGMHKAGFLGDKHAKYKPANPDDPPTSAISLDLSDSRKANEIKDKITQLTPEINRLEERQLKIVKELDEIKQKKVEEANKQIKWAQEDIIAEAIITYEESIDVRHGREYLSERMDRISKIGKLKDQLGRKKIQRVFELTTYFPDKLLKDEYKKNYEELVKLKQELMEKLISSKIDEKKQIKQSALDNIKNRIVAYNSWRTTKLNEANEVPEIIELNRLFNAKLEKLRLYTGANPAKNIAYGLLEDIDPGTNWVSVSDNNSQSLQIVKELIRSKFEDLVLVYHLGKDVEDLPALSAQIKQIIDQKMKDGKGGFMSTIYTSVHHDRFINAVNRMIPGKKLYQYIISKEIPEEYEEKISGIRQQGEIHRAKLAADYKLWVEKHGKSVVDREAELDAGVPTESQLAQARTEAEGTAEEEVNKRREEQTKQQAQQEKEEMATKLKEKQRAVDRAATREAAREVAKRKREAGMAQAMEDAKALVALAREEARQEREAGMAQAQSGKLKKKDEMGGGGRRSRKASTKKKSRRKASTKKKSRRKSRRKVSRKKSRKKSSRKKKSRRKSRKKSSRKKKSRIKSSRKRKSRRRSRKKVDDDEKPKRRSRRKSRRKSRR